MPILGVIIVSLALAGAETPGQACVDSHVDAGMAYRGCVETKAPAA